MKDHSKKSYPILISNKEIQDKVMQVLAMHGREKESRSTYHVGETSLQGVMRDSLQGRYYIVSNFENVADSVETQQTTFEHSRKKNPKSVVMTSVISLLINVLEFQ